MKSLYKRIAMRIPFWRDVIELKETTWALNESVLKLRAVSVASLMLEERRTNPRFLDPKRLLNCAHQVNSQNGEDGMIREIFNRIGIGDRVFVEIGVGNGLENNSAFLLSQGWSGLWIDGSDAFLPRLAALSAAQKNSLRYLVSMVDRENIVDLLERSLVPKEFDLLSIDIDQNTYHVWDALDDYRPRVAIIEYNATIPADLEWKSHYDARRVWDGSFNYGASLKSLELLGLRKGYSLVGCDYSGVNAFFVRSDLVDGQFASPFTSENHYEPPRYFCVAEAGHTRSFLDANG